MTLHNHTEMFQILSFCARIFTNSLVDIAILIVFTVLANITNMVNMWSFSEMYAFIFATVRFCFYEWTRLAS